MGRPAYQEEPIHLREIIWNRGYIEPLEFFRIAAWKSARSLASLSIAKRGTIEKATDATLKNLKAYRDAPFPPGDPGFWERPIERWAMGQSGIGLRGMPGVQMPMASAILCILNPHASPVIDRWALPMVFKEVPWNGTQLFWGYRAYVEALADIRDRHYRKSSIHEVDQIAYEAGRKGLSVTFRPSPLVLDEVPSR